MSDRPDWCIGTAKGLSERLRRAGMSPRKARLFCVACCRESLRLIWDNPSKALLDLVERWADDPALAREVRNLRRAVGQWAKGTHPRSRSDSDWRARWMVHCAADTKIVPPAAGFLEAVEFRPRLADIFGDLGPRSFDPAWRTPDVMRVAQAIYESRDFEALPALLDALLDAGCSDAELIAHCRSYGQHTRGCWALDLALGLA